MKYILSSMMLLCATLLAQAQALDIVTVPVLRSTPVYAEYYNTRTECVRTPVYRDRYVPQGHRRHQDAAGGALLGGLLGYGLGKGHRDKDLAIVAGAIVGGVVGNRHHRRHHDDYHVREKEIHYIRDCRPVQDFHERIVHWRVDYEFEGRVQSTTMYREPGRYIQVRVHHEVID